MLFEHIEDKTFFADLLCDGDKSILEDKYSSLFDFRNPLLKREEFNIKKKQWMQRIVEKRGEKCQLQLVPDCNDVQLVLDHMIPLSSNELNKHLRNLKATAGKKVLSQSFGSNSLNNFVLACKACNNFKKHRFVKRDGNKYKIVDWK